MFFEVMMVAYTHGSSGGAEVVVLIVACVGVGESGGNRW